MWPVTLSPRSAVGRFGAAQSGASAVEFALFAPVLCLALLTTIDLGTALSERMSLGQVLRSGSQVAMEDPGVVKVERVLESTAKRNFQTESANPTDNSFVIGNTLDLSAERFCACPEAPDIAVACATTCAGTVPTFIFYRLQASKQFAGVLLRNLPLGASTQVQVR
jgi:Flp pilus assembly pilin Flp